MTCEVHKFITWTLQCVTEWTLPQMRKELRIYNIITSGIKGFEKHTLHLLVRGSQTANPRVKTCEPSIERTLKQRQSRGCLRVCGKIYCLWPMNKKNKTEGKCRGQNIWLRKCWVLSFFYFLVFLAICYGKQSPIWVKISEEGWGYIQAWLTSMKSWILFCDMQKKKEKVKQNNTEQPRGKILVKNTDANKIIMQIMSKSVTNGKAEGIR